MEDYVSVIIPVYNRKNLLKRAIDSVLNQKYKKFELIIINDFSEENIDGLIKKYKDHRIRFFKNNKNMGVSYSRNIGIKNANYDLIALLDSDDEWLPLKLIKQIDYIKKNQDINLVHTEEIWIRNDKRVNQKKRHKKIGGDIFIPSLELCLISPSSVLLKKNLFDKYGYFDESLPVCEDYDLWLRITAFEEAGFINEPLIIKYGGHNDQLSKKYHAMDKFRVKSMLKLYNINNLKKEKKDALNKIILKKSNILLQGALKRKKEKDAEIYKNWIKNLK